MDISSACSRILFGKTRTSRAWWLGASLVFSVLLAVWGLLIAFGHPLVIQDDARQHVFWMARFIDPSLFPNDPIAEYFHSVAPLGYRAVYRVAYWVGINPFLFNKLLPLLLGLAGTYYGFRLCMVLFPHESTAFLSTVLLNLSLWIKDDLASGTPRAFVYALFIPFCYYLLRRSMVQTLVLVVLQGLIYPQVLLISFCTLFLRLFSWENRRLRFCTDRDDLKIAAASLLTALLVLLPFSLGLSHFGPVVKGSQAKLMSEFGQSGRAEFFLPDTVRFYARAARSGYLPKEWFRFPKSLLLLLLLVFPVCLGMKKRLPLLKDMHRDAILLLQMLVAASFLFVAAHVLLFKLHLPSRYPNYCLRLIMSIGGAISISALIDALCRSTRPGAPRSRSRQVALVLLLLFPEGLVLSAMVRDTFPKVNYIVGRQADLYDYLKTQPKNVCIASLAEEASNIPSFAQRTILVGTEYAIPYHLGYYLPFREKTRRLIEAHYTEDPAVLRKFIQDYHVDLFVVEDTAFSPTYLLDDDWTNQCHELSGPISKGLAGNLAPVLRKVLARCPRRTFGAYTVVAARDILDALGTLPPAVPGT